MPARHSLGGCKCSRRAGQTARAPIAMLRCTRTRHRVHAYYVCSDVHVVSIGSDVSLDCFWSSLSVSVVAGEPVYAKDC